MKYQNIDDSSLVELLYQKIKLKHYNNWLILFVDYHKNKLK